MSARVGKHQLRVLMLVASPYCVLVTQDKVSRALVSRGLLREDAHGGALITPDGLRALADAMNRGEVELVLADMRRERAKRRAAQEASC